MKIDLKLLTILALAGFSISLYFGARADQEFFSDFMNNMLESQTKDRFYEFSNTYGSIKRIEAGEVDAVLFQLYRYAHVKSQSIDRKNLPDRAADELIRFQMDYSTYIARKCAADIIEACLSFGSWLAEVQRYDEAHRALRKAADAGNLAAMAALVDLHREDGWAGRSEERALEWLGKVGKQ